MTSISFMDWVSSVKGAPSHAVGSSPLERLPTELLNRILLYVAAPIPRKGWMPHILPGDNHSSPSSLLSCLLVSHRIHDIALFIMYRSPNIKTSKTSSITRFFDCLQRNPGLKSLTRTFDITRCTPSNFSFTTNHLSHLPQLRDLRLSLSHIKDISILYELLFRLLDLESLTLDISRLHENVSMLRGVFDSTSLPNTQCSTLNSLKLTDISGTGGLQIPGVLESLLPRMSKLRILDVSRTCVTVSALSSLPPTAKLTHLNIWGCLDLDLDDLVNFLVSHPGVRNTLRVLKAGSIADAAPLSERQISTLLASAPPTLRSLDLSLSNMGPSNIPHLQRLCRAQLSELSVGRNLSLCDIEDMLLRPHYEFRDLMIQEEEGEEEEEEEEEEDEEAEATKEGDAQEIMSEPMRNALALCRLRRRLDSVVSRRGVQRSRSRSRPGSRLRYLNLSSMMVEEQGLIAQSVILGRESGVEVVDVSGFSWEDWGVLKRVCRAVGWRERWEGRRVWVERL
ncbi:uncharacterized protein RAG0_16537 [Rhynchosporium agropyri]|uniref:Leucine Rich Repeat domain protein n=1 Tax=Rhynchosporium agropyri TaxID=914238 RepID=A0A1E1LQU0_9HELO|nr:uncharacterized protein RAG0_16537 [Rhynchosporium agropyri]